MVKHGVRRCESHFRVAAGRRLFRRAWLPPEPERVLVLYAPDDGIIPAAETRALLDLFPQTPRVARFSGGHNVPLTQADLWREVEAFVRE